MDSVNTGLGVWSYLNKRGLYPKISRYLLDLSPKVLLSFLHTSNQDQVRLPADSPSRSKNEVDVKYDGFSRVKV